MRDGAYAIRKKDEAKPTRVMLVMRDRACGYQFRWIGELAMYEYSRCTDVFYDLRDYYSDPYGATELAEDLFGISLKNESEVEYFDFLPEDMESGFLEGGVSGDALAWWEAQFSSSSKKAEATIFEADGEIPV